MAGCSQGAFSILDYLCMVGLLALLVSFVRTVAEKWGILEWMQSHAPSEFLHKLLTCNFCLSFWIGMVISIFLAIFVHWTFIFLPIFSSNLR